MSMEGTDAFLVERFYIRQQDIINKASLVPVSILGCGASGSALGLQLAKLGVPMLGLWDADTVEEHNLSNQYYPNSAVGMNKAEVLGEIIKQYTPRELLPMISVHPENFNRENESRTNCDIAFLAVDGFGNMREVFDILDEDEGVHWVIATRMGAEYFEVYSISMDSEEEKRKYRESMEGEGNPLPCTGRSVIYNAMCMAGYAVSMFKKILSEERLPFKIGVDLKNYIPPLVEWRDDARLVTI